MTKLNLDGFDLQSQCFNHVNFKHVYLQGFTEVHLHHHGSQGESQMFFVSGVFKISGCLLYRKRIQKVCFS